LRDTSRIVDYRVINEDTMLVSGSLGEVLKSTDGGVNWESIFESPQSAYVAQIELRPDQTGFAIIKADSGGLNNYHLYSISNNALQWDYILNLDQNPGYLQLLEDQTVIISNLPNNQLMISVDNGQNWTTASAPVSTNKTYFINDSVGIIYSNSYPDYITVNSGADWNTISSLGKKILAVQFVNNQQGIAICYDGLYKTQDQGQSWDLEYPYSFNTLLPSFISYANDTAAYVLGFDENSGEAFLLTSYGLQWIKEPISIAKLNVYPNPAKDIITLDLNDYQGNLNYQLFNLTGQKVGEGRILGNSIPIASLAKGFYTLYIQSDNQLKYTAKFEKL
ncbi:MAG: T9SS type A sorting domain-containing protein, partial [Bacteroidales bacterium]|nr:T9SS type A sorting domain-containing protein [Bacteroidales bacterium]